jgi:Reverse transcriptase (RNA-dependent DNA polymerase).
VTLPNLSTKGRTAHVLPGLTSGNLLSLGQILDDNEQNTAILTAKKAKILHKQKLIAEGYRNNTTNGMWHITTPGTQQLNNMHHNLKTHKDLVTFLHAACFSPAKSTFLHAIKQGFLHSWPGLIAKKVAKYLTEPAQTIKGHMDQEFKGIRSTKQNNHVIDSPTSEPRTNNVMVDTLQPNDKAYSDITGRFPHIGRNGHQYIFIMYHYDTNAIIPHPMKDRTESEHINAWKTCYKYLEDRGQKPTLHIMDNETSNNLLRAIQRKKVQIQLVPPHVHRRNAAERAIRTFKNHFIAGLCSVHPHFPMTLWADLLPQAAITLNLLRPCRLNPRLSAYNALEGAFDFNRTPLAPPGMKVIVHEKPQQRTSWSPHGIDGWYIGPALRHYRCFTCYIPRTHATRIADTVHFIPHAAPVPAVTTADAISKAADDLAKALQNPLPTVPLVQQNDETQHALARLTDIFHTLQRQTQQHSQQSNPQTITLPAPLPRVMQTPPVASPRVPTPSQPAIALPPTTQGSTSPRVPQEEQLPAPHATDTPAHIPATPTHLQQRLQNKLQAFQRARRSTKSYHPSDLYRPYNRPSLRRQQTIHTPILQAVIDATTGRVLEYRHLIHPTSPVRDIWLRAMSTEIGRLAQGLPGQAGQGTNTIKFIAPSQVPKEKFVTYARIVSDIRPQKDDPNRIRITVGGNLLHYDHDTGTPSADLTTTKLFLNSVISSDHARFITLDVKDFYLNTPMPEFEYMRIPLRLLPEEVITHYKLRDLAEGGEYAYMEIQKGMYGLKQAGRIAYDQLQTHLAKYGYRPTTTQGLWKHDTRNISFILVVDDFGIKYTNEQDAHHLIQALQDLYKVNVDWTGSLYCGLTIQWHYDEQYVDISMPGYIEKVLTKFQHPPPRRKQDAPAPWNQPAYGQRIQYAVDDTSPAADKAQKTRIQQIVGSLLYYARAVDYTMLVALNDISHEQNNPTTQTLHKVTQLLDYAATHPDATVRFYRSNMILWIDSDAAYLVACGARSRAGGFFHLADLPKLPIQNVKQNGAVHIESTLIRQVMAAASEAELGAAFINAQKAVPIRQALIDMGHPQPPTPLKTDNSTAHGILTSLVRQKRSKAFDMRFYWPKDRIKQNQFQVYWKPGTENRADYFTKNHPPAHHRAMRSHYLHHISTHNESMRGCVIPIPAQSTPTDKLRTAQIEICTMDPTARQGREHKQEVELINYPK